MILKKIKLENIRSYENQEIVFPSGSTLLSGDIGSGKTSVLMAIEFALFGLQPTQRGTSLLRNGKDEGRVILELDINGKSIVLERTLKQSKKSVNQDYANISIDNEKTEASVTEIKSKVLELLNYPSEFAKKTNLLYKFTVYTPQEEMRQIILESPETRLNTLRHIFGIDKYKRIEENISIFTSKLREEIRNKEGQLADTEQIKRNLEDKKSKFQTLKETQENEIRTLEEKKKQRQETENQARELETKISEKENLEREKDKTNFMLMNKKDSLFDINNQIKKLIEELEELGKVIFDIKKFEEIKHSIEKNRKEQEKLQEQLISISGKINSLEERKKEAFQLQEKISKLTKCPTCLQEVNEQYKTNIHQNAEQEISRTNKEIGELRLPKEKLSQSIDSLRQQVKTLEEERSEQEILKIKLETLKEKEKNLEELTKKQKQINSDINLLLQQIKILDENIKGLSIFLPRFEQKNKELQLKIQEEREQEIKTVELKKESTMIQQQISEIEETIKEKLELKKRTDYLRELENWLSDKFLNMILFTERNVMLKLKEEFSKLFTEWFSILVPETISARLSEDFTPIIEQQGYEISYAYLSGGERTAVALAYRLALNQVINSLLSRIKTRDIVILDEPTDGFSESQLDKMRDVLSQLKVQQLILVSHESKIESFVEKIIKFKKEGGVTKVET